ncbi:hypothetical protein [Propionivibrio sp.]|uniref:hypothetical protein n=1 Tax=Propionivibrio sp. TaxID=2212460 RepID=UPI00272DD5C3|nr:hypothetical protein [Propionivibrio sp.]
MVEELLNNSMAAQTLSELLKDKTPEKWAVWLQNNRNQSRRVSYRIPFQRISGGIFYSRDELEKFVEFEKSLQLGALKLTGRVAEVVRAFGIGQGGSNTGRKLNVTGINPQVDEATGQCFVQVVIGDPLLVFRLEVGEAKSLCRELTEAIGVCERAGQ